jgi:hypothetical protein
MHFYAGKLPRGSSTTIEKFIIKIHAAFCTSAYKTKKPELCSSGFAESEGFEPGLKLLKISNLPTIKQATLLLLTSLYRYSANTYLR